MFRTRFKLWVAASLLVAPLSAALIVAAACAVVYSAGNNSTPSASAHVPASTPRGLGLSYPWLSGAALTSAPPAAQVSANDGGLHLDFVWPTDGVVTQGMTPRHPSGVDIGAAVGTDVHAVRDGTVYFAGGDPCCSYGNFVIVAHNDGWTSVYAHLSAFRAKVGDQVKQGDVIALSGDTGHVTGPHLHFELRYYGVPVNPLDHFWPARFVMQDDPNAPLDPSTPPPELAFAPPAPTDAPTEMPTMADPASTHLGATEAVVLGVDWMTRNYTYSYTIDASTCYAVGREINWLVTCKGTMQGCAGGAVCERYLSACVLDQPRLIAQFCP